MYKALIFSENKEVVSSGTIISFNNDPIIIKLIDNMTQVVQLKFAFKNDNSSKEPSVTTDIVDNTLVLTLTNFDNPIGIGSTSPINFAKYKNQDLYLHYRVTSLSQSDRTLYYTIYAEEENSNGTNK